MSGKAGVCMLALAQLTATADTTLGQVSGEVDQSAGMLDDEAKRKGECSHEPPCRPASHPLRTAGYALLCVSMPLGDCRIATIEEVSPAVAHGGPQLMSHDSAGAGRDLGAGLVFLWLT